MFTKNEISYMGHLPRITAEIVDILQNFDYNKITFSFRRIFKLKLTIL